MSEEATLSSILLDEIEPNPYEALKESHPILHEKLEALRKRDEDKELAEEDTLWEIMKLFVESDLNPFALDGML